METDKKAILERFNKTIQQWIDQLEDYSLDMLQQRPAVDSWSLGQVYVHIIEDTTFYVEQMKAALASDDLHAEKSMHTRAKAMFENGGMPDMALENPFNDINLRQPESKHELLQSMTFIKEEVNRLFATGDLSSANGKTEHPGFAFFDTWEWLQFAEMHMRHHLRQKKRIDESIFRS